ncbi:MAG: transcriptional repressor, partial [Ilumatobacteraceae bacterium]
MPDDIVHLLRSNGLQVTAPRVAILRAVESRPHATADEVLEEVRGAIGTVSRQAVYDSLGALADRQLLRRI